MPTLPTSSNQTSTAGKRWLKKTRQLKPPRIIRSTPANNDPPHTSGEAPDIVVDTPAVDQPAKTPTPNFKFVSISVPDVTATPADSVDNQEFISDPQAIAKSLADASEDRLKELAFRLDSTAAPAILRKTPSSIVSEATPKTASRPATPYAELAIPPTSPPASQPTPPPAPTKPTIVREQRPEITTQAVPTVVQSAAPEIKAEARELTRIVDSILDRFPIQQPVVLQFVSSESNPQTDKTCAQVARDLARRRIGRVLLMDANESERKLTATSGTTNALGITDAVVDNKQWEHLLQTGQSESLDFLPAGRCHLNRNSISFACGISF